MITPASPLLQRPPIATSVQTTVPAEFTAQAALLGTGRGCVDRGGQPHRGDGQKRDIRDFVEDAPTVHRGIHRIPINATAVHGMN